MKLKVENLKIIRDRVILEEVNLSFGNKIYGIQGDSGSGKSSFIQAILGLIEYEGNIFYNDKLLQKPRDRKGFQIVYQNPFNSFDPTATFKSSFKEMLRWNNNSKNIEYYIEKVGLPLDYLNKKPSQLSGGELQRMAIGRAIAGLPEVLLMDEPTSALDVSTQKSILDLILSLVENTCVLFISHDLRVLDYVSDEIYILNEKKRKFDRAL